MSEWRDDASDPGPRGLGGDFRSDRPRLDSPMTWSVPVCRLGSVTVRMHATFLLLIAVELLRSTMSVGGRTLALPPTALVLGCLAGLAVLHEAARTWSHRRAGGDLDEWLLWPLGGLCSADPGERRHAPWIAGAGWLAQFALAVCLAAVLRAWTGRWVDGALPRPWTLEGFRELTLGGASAGLEAAWLLQWTLLVSLALQALPAFPLTGGRCLLAALEARRGWGVAAHGVARSGVVCAVTLLVAGLAFDAWTLQLLALVCWIASQETIQRVDASDGFERDRVPEVPRAGRGAADDRAELDRILEKINRGGMRSLSWRERWRLRAATRRRQDGGGGIR